MNKVNIPLRNTLSMIYDNVYRPERNRLDELTRKLIADHNTLSRSDAVAVFYKGFHIYNGQKHYGRKYQAIHRELRHRFQEHRANLERLDAAEIQTTQSLSAVILDTFTGQDIRDFFSDNIVYFLPLLSRYERTREEAFHILDKPIKLQQWNKTKEYIEYYLVNRMVL